MGSWLALSIHHFLSHPCMAGRGLLFNQAPSPLERIMSNFGGPSAVLLCLSISDLRLRAVCSKNDSQGCNLQEMWVGTIRLMKPVPEI